MASWLTFALKRIRELAVQGRVRFTVKALFEIEELDPELAEEDVCDLLARLESEDFISRFRSRSTGEWMYVFKPIVEETVVYVKLILRLDCILISFHEDEEHG